MHESVGKSYRTTYTLCHYVCMYIWYVHQYIYIYAHVHVQPPCRCQVEGELYALRCPVGDAGLAALAKASVLYMPSQGCKSILHGLGLKVLLYQNSGV